MTMIKKFPLVVPPDFKGRNLKYGVREFAMATVATGLYRTGMITPFIGTFLTFSDYMRNATRLAALQKAHVIYQFTHDYISWEKMVPHTSLLNIMLLYAQYHSSKSSALAMPMR